MFEVLRQSQSVNTLQLWVDTSIGSFVFEVLILFFPYWKNYNFLSSLCWIFSSFSCSCRSGRFYLTIRHTLLVNLRFDTVVVVELLRAMKYETATQQRCRCSAINLMRTWIRIHIIMYVDPKLVCWYGWWLPSVECFPTSTVFWSVNRVDFFFTSSDFLGGSSSSKKMYR